MVNNFLLFKLNIEILAFLNFGCKTRLLLTLFKVCIKFLIILAILLISFNFSYIFNKFYSLNVDKLFIKCLQNLINAIHKLY